MIIMGYTTTFEGRLDFSRELTRAEFQTLRELEDVNCDWVPTADGLGLEHNGMEKSYYAVEWVQWIIDKFLTPWGVVVNGAPTADGHDGNDIWRLKVNDNVATKQAARIVYDDV